MQQEASPSSRLFRTCPRDPPGRLPVTRVPAPPCPASARRATPGRPGPNGKRPPRPPRRPRTAGPRNASTGAGAALRPEGRLRPGPPGARPSTATSGDPRRSKKGEERLRQRVPGLAVPAPARPGRVGPGAQGNPGPSRRFPVTTTTDGRRPRPGAQPPRRLTAQARFTPPPAGAPTYSREVGGAGRGPASRAARDPIGERRSRHVARAWSGAQRPMRAPGGGAGGAPVSPRDRHW